SGESKYVLRRHKNGDRISPLGMRGTRLVSDIISDAKLSRKEKSQMRVLARKSDDEIIWVAGLKRSRYDLIELNSGCCFKLELMKDEQSAM
ncbi:MAG: tRNA lysidine(34) synthetase TilS, partial [Muribaculaceae bacterium]|nr:tRNA lysidine(34) synthetase TilS [Muribaculaceae bacterium]